MNINPIKILSISGLMLVFLNTSLRAAETVVNYFPENSLWDTETRFDNNPLSYKDDYSLQLAQIDSPSTNTNLSLNNSSASTSASTAENGGYTQAQINEMINNPLGELWMLFIQNDTTWYDGDALDYLGEGKKVFNTTTIEPVMPFQLTENIKYIFRPVIPVHRWDAPTVSKGNTRYPGGDLPFDVEFEEQTELGDIILWNAFGTNEMVKPPNIFGFGVTAMLDTATDEIFGTGKNSVGPMAIAFHVGPPKGYIIGTIVQHWWSVSGDEDRSDVNMTNIQYVAFYRLNAETNIGFGSPNISANWEADNDDVWTIPVGLGYNTMTKIGPLPIKVGIEAYKYIEKPDNFGAEYGLRIFIAPIVPSPAFSKEALFGG